MRKVIIIVLVALLGLSCFMVGRKIWEYGNIKEDVLYYEKTKELDNEIEKVNKDIEDIKTSKKDELERLEKWQKTLEELKESL